MEGYHGSTVLFIAAFYYLQTDLGNLLNKMVYLGYPNKDNLNLDFGLILFFCSCYYYIIHV